MTAGVGAAVTARVTGVRAKRGGTEVLHGIDVELRAGEVVALLGPNGAGKSTLVDVIGGILGPSAGEVELSGRVATVMQTPGLAARSVQANVELALAWWGVPKAERAGRAQRALAQLGVAGLARRRADTLSGGQRRRVHLARGLAVEPQLLLLDEPFAGLDPSSHALLRDDIAASLRSEGRAVLVVVHDRADAWALADRLLVLVDGRLAAEGTPDAVLADPGSAQVARLLGYDGELRHGDLLAMTRSSRVQLDPSGPIEGVVTRAVREPDGARIRVEAADGTLWATTPDPSAAPVGGRVRVRAEVSVDVAYQPEG